MASKVSTANYNLDTAEGRDAYRAAQRAAFSRPAPAARPAARKARPSAPSRSSWQREQDEMDAEDMGHYGDFRRR